MFQHLFDIILSCQSKFDCCIQCPPWNLGIFFSLFCLCFYFLASFVLTSWPFFVSQPIFHATHCAPLVFQSIGHALNSYPFAMHQEHVLQSRPFGLIPQNTKVASTCLPLLPTPLVALEFQMDHMMPFQSHHPNGSICSWDATFPSMASFMLEVSQGWLCSHGHHISRSTTLGNIFRSMDGSTPIIHWATTSIGGNHWARIWGCGKTIGRYDEVIMGCV